MRIVPFLGLILDHNTKTVKIVPKTIAKIQQLRENRRSWTIGHFRSLGALLLYCFLATKKDVGKYQYVLQAWATVQGVLVQQPSMVKGTWDEPPALTPLLDEWIDEAIANEPHPVAPREAAPIDFYVITDASGLGYGGIVVSAKSGQCTVIQGKWGSNLLPYCQSSSRAEPLGMYCVLREFFDKPGASAVIQHFGDNQGSENITNKGYSTKPSQIVMELLQRELPGIHVKSRYTPGATIPADRVSRMEDADPEEVKKFFENEGINVDLEFGRFLRVTPDTV